MVADVIPPTLSSTNSPTSQNNKHYRFKPFNNHTILLITCKTHSIHTHDLTKACTRKTLIKSFTIYRDVSKTIADNNMKRGDDPVTMVKESMNDTVPQTLYGSSAARAHSVNSTGRTSDTATTGNWSTK